jgi:N-acetylglucosamine-6-phosphate deacetylase
MEKVYKKGCKHFTHLYSGMSTITRHDGYRKLGIIESAYYYDDVYAEVIADGKHLPPELLKLIVKCKGTEHICLVTDAMRGAGQLSGESYLGKKGEEVPCIIDDGVAKLPDLTAFAGSVATADRLVRTMVKEAGVSVEDAVKMITEVPAEICGFATKGKIKENYDADIVIFDDNINVKNVIVGGKIIK